MSLPAAATKVNLDAATDDPSQARVELVALIDKFNALLSALPTDFLGINGNAASATTAAGCSGNAATSSSCSGNSATASSCSGNSATATTATNANGTGTIPKAPAGMRIIHGVFWGADGSITSGSGFTVTRNSAQDYTVTFTAAFSGLPTITVSGGFGHYVSLNGLANSYVRFYASTSDCAVYFIAIGPN